MLVATRPEPPAAVLVMVGDDALTAGTIDGGARLGPVAVMMRISPTRLGLRRWSPWSRRAPASASLTASTASTSLPRLGVAATVLSVFAAVAALLVTPRASGPGC